MLVLTRKRNESIVIGAGITVTVLDIRGGKVRLGLEAPSDVRIDREEIRQVGGFKLPEGQKRNAG